MLLHVIWYTDVIDRLYECEPSYSSWLSLDAVTCCWRCYERCRRCARCTREGLHAWYVRRLLQRNLFVLHQDRETRRPRTKCPMLTGSTYRSVVHQRDCVASLFETNRNARQYYVSRFARRRLRVFSRWDVAATRWSASLQAFVRTSSALQHRNRLNLSATIAWRDVVLSYETIAQR